MKKKRRLPLLILNLLAAIAAAGSAWLQWWQGAWPATTDSAQLLTATNVEPVDFLPFSIAMVIFVAAGLMLGAALTGWKLLGFLGALIGGAIIVTWFINSGINFDLSLFNLDQIDVIGYGTLAMAGAVIVALIALFIPKKHVKEK